MRYLLALAVVASAVAVGAAGSVSADSFVVRLVSQTNSTLTLGWDPQPGYGYLFSADGVLRSRTNDPNVSTVKFSKQYSAFEVAVIVKGATGMYPPAAPPPPPALSAPQNLRATATTQTSITVAWDAVANATNYRVFRDGVLLGQGPGSSAGFANEWTDGGRTCGTTYTYGVDAQDAAGNTSVRSTVALATTSCDGSPPPPSSASVFLSPSGNDANACTAVAPCRTVARGYAAAADDATVQMDDGFYPCVTLSGAKRVTFAASAGARPWIACNNTIRGLYSDGYSLQFVNASNITMNGIYVAGVEWKEGTGVHDITFNDVHVTCLSNDPAHFELWGGLCNAKIEGAAVNLTMNGGEVGPTIDNELGSYPGSSRIMGGSNIVLNGVTFHHNEREPGGHSECLMIEGGDPVKVINSRFLSCNTYNIFITCFPCANGSYGSQPDNVLIENNYFGPGPQYFAIELRDTNPRSRIDYRYNTFYKFVGVGAGYGDFRGNIVAHSGGCPGSSYTVKYNVWGDDIGRTCGDSTNVTVRSSPFTTDGAGYDLVSGHLGSSSVAIGKGDPANFPATDIDGQTRPIGSVDAGSDER